jgi:hypothetical protein
MTNLTAKAITHHSDLRFESMYDQNSCIILEYILRTFSTLVIPPTSGGSKVCCSFTKESLDIFIQFFYKLIARIKMKIKSNEGLQTKFPFESLIIFLTLAFVIWISRYWFSANFGLYEDDYSRIPNAVVMTGDQLWEYVRTTILKFGGQGRPLHPVLIYLFSWIGWKFKQLNSLYWFGYIILTINGYLIYLILKRVGNKALALVGALIFCVYPSDTTQIYLTHSFGVQISLMFLLIASPLYLSGHRMLSYFIIFGSLITYETIYLVFLAIPLLKSTWDYSLWREIRKHALILVTALIGIFLLRRFIGEDRVIEMDIFKITLLSIRGLLTGPPVSIGLFFYRPIQVLLSLKREMMVGMGLVLIPTTWILSKIHLNTPVGYFEQIRRFQFKNLSFKKLFNKQAAEQFINQINENEIYKLLLVGLAMLILAYPLMLTVSGLNISGRATRVHFAAVVGALLIIACLSTAILGWAITVGKKRTGVFILALFITFQSGFGISVQRDYQLSWEYQRKFWTDLIQLIPDANPGTVILIEPEGLPATEQIGAISWNLPRILNNIYEFPSDWVGNYPRVYLLKHNWKGEILLDETVFQLNNKTVKGSRFFYRDVNARDVLIIGVVNGELSRHIGPMIINGTEVKLKQVANPMLPSFEKGVLFDYLITNTP